MLEKPESINICYVLLQLGQWITLHPLSCHSTAQHSKSLYKEFQKEQFRSVRYYINFHHAKPFPTRTICQQSNYTHCSSGKEPDLSPGLSSELWRNWGEVTMKAPALHVTG